MANRYFKAFLILALIFVTDMALAQGPPPPPPPLAPVDGGILGLLALGLGFAIKKIYDKTKN